MISCVMPTYRRMTCVERSISLFCSQSHTDSELIVFNTDTEYPIVLGDTLLDKPIRVVNNNIDSHTGQEYTDVGSIRRDALAQAKGDFYICWDDDDIFLPWNNQQCIDGIQNTSLSAWKPKSSMWCLRPNSPEITQNYMEASYIVRIEALRACGYDKHAGGGEHLRWVHKFNKEKSVLISSESIPAYSFNWSDPQDIGGHKNSGSIKRADNYQHHRNGCTDKHTRPLNLVDTRTTIEPYIRLLKQSVGNTYNGHTITEEVFNKYVLPYI